MEFFFSFKHMETSDALKKYTEEKTREKIMKYAPKPLKTQVIFSIDRHQHMVQCTVTGGNGLNLQVEHACEDMYASVDKMLDKLEVQLRRHKEKNKDRKVGDSWKARRHERHSQRPWKEQKGDFDIENEEIDAEDILKFEMARRMKTA